MSRPLLAVLLLAAAATAGLLDDFHWREEFGDAARWEPRPAWLANASTTASVVSEGGVACFRVREPRRGMKWAAATPVVSLLDTPWLVVRYRAEHLVRGSGDYVVHLDDRVRGRQLNALRFQDARPDGRWHVAAVDVTTLTQAEGVYGLAVQVQADADGDAHLWLDWLAFLPQPPKDAEIIRRAPAVPAKPDWTAPLDQATWVPHTDWLGNPASKGRHGVERKGGRWVFRVAEAGRGMKWSWALPEKVELAGRRYVAMRYRATGLARRGDYALCVIGTPRGDGLDYAPVIAPTELIADGRWHTVHADARPAARDFEAVGALALQAQATAPDATLEVADIRLVNAIRPSRLGDLIDWKSGKRFQEPFFAIPLGEAANSESGAWRRHLRIADWFRQEEIIAHGIPFRLRRIGPIGPIGPMGRGESALAGTSIARKGELRIPADVKASEVYLLLLAALVGPEEPVYGGGRFGVIRDVDRFRLRLEYADGTADECLPMQVPWRREGEAALGSARARPAEPRFAIVPGPQVLVAAADPSRKLKALVLHDRCKQAAFALAAVTARTAGEPAFPEAVEREAPLRHKRGKWVAQETQFYLPAGKTPAHRHMVVRGPECSASLRMHSLPVIDGLTHRRSRWEYIREPIQLVEITVDGKRLKEDDLKTDFAPWPIAIVVDPEHPKGGYAQDDPDPRPGEPFEDWLCSSTVKGTELLVDIAFYRSGVHWPVGFKDTPTYNGFTFIADVTNTGEKPHRVAITAPVLGPFRASKRPEKAYYLLPRRGAVLDNRDCSYRERYCGTFPVQFIDTVSPTEGRGVCVWTADAECLPKTCCFDKSKGDFTIRVEYPERVLGPGESYHTAPTVVAVTDGDWHRGFETYREWLRTWHKPLSPRKRWFREIFNFRQRFLHSLDPLYDHGTGEFHLERAVEEAKREFGGIDYLHLFDWGNCGKYGRIYGRTGDYSPYDFLQGGRDAFREAIAGVQAQGVPTGLYIEGYLLTARGKLGQAHGKDWQSIRRDGKGAWWPGSVEMSLCAGVEAWREVQASTYETKVKELGVDGMYIDQFGFANAGKDCYSDKHGHPVPSYCVRTERDTTKTIRERVEAAKKGVAIYTEETPVDVTTQYQDGSFTYAMNAARRTRTLVPLNLARFAFPDFKTIEILICDKPTGSWATGVRWVFFNGEALWLEGPADEWFEPETRAEIHRCYRILRKHRDAFTSLEPVPLVPTEMGGVWANQFPARRAKTPDAGASPPSVPTLEHRDKRAGEKVPGAFSKVVYTLYNARHRAVRGAVLRLPHREGATYYDEWRQRPATVRRDGAHVYLATELGPHGTGCLVVERE